VTTPAEFSAAITDIQLQSREGSEVRWRMTLSTTEFQPGDTGVLIATSRSGTRIEVPVLRVVNDSGDIWHVVEKPLAAGTDVIGHVTQRD
jgi:Ser-tRNA(Ala) deacylase AlaX